MNPKNIITVRVAEGLLTKDQLGNACDALPVYPVSDDIAIDEMGNAADVWPVTTDTQNPLTDIIPVFDVGGPAYIDALGNKASAIPVKGLVPPVPPVPGPLDKTFNDSGLTSLTVQYDLAANIAVLGVATLFDGTLTGATATHGGEYLTLISRDINEENKIATFLFMGSGLTIEPSNVVVTPVGGATLGPAALRINDDYTATSLGSHWNGGSVGSRWGDTPTQTIADVSGLNGLIYAGASLQTGNELYPKPTSEYQKLSWLISFAGTRVDDTPWVVSQFDVVDGAYIHTSAIDGQLIYTLPAPITGYFGYEVDVQVADDLGAELSIQNLSGASVMSRTLTGPYDGMWRVVCGSNNYTTDKIKIIASGDVTIRSIKYIIDPKAISSVFGRSVADVSNGDTYSLYIPTSGGWATSVAEVYDAG